MTKKITLSGVYQLLCAYNLVEAVIDKPYYHMLIKIQAGERMEFSYNSIGFDMCLVDRRIHTDIRDYKGTFTINFEQFRKKRGRRFINWHELQ